jgi:hypothetical protein
MVFALRARGGFPIHRSVPRSAATSAAAGTCRQSLVPAVVVRLLSCLDFCFAYDVLQSTWLLKIIRNWQVLSGAFVIFSGVPTNATNNQAMQPRFQAEYFIRECLQELDRYAMVFQERIVSAFANLEEEAKRIEDETYVRMGDHINPEYADPEDGMEEAFHVGVNYYLTTDAVRQGVFNLMTAGLFHMLEQQAQYLATRRVLLDRIIQADVSGGLKQLQNLLKQSFDIEIKSFQSWTLLNELRLVANTIKHGDGGSADELKLLNPALFRDPLDPFPHIPNVPLRPLVGEGLRLTVDHFNKYKSCVDQFWQELIDALVPVFCPQSSPTSTILGNEN